MDNKLFGKVFIQIAFPAIGKSSYHFDSPENCYIRFDGWGADDLPHLKRFTNVHFDLTNRVFIGTIDWSEEGGYEGQLYWVYLMVFDSEYRLIERGYVSNDADQKVTSFSTDLKYVLAPPALTNTSINNDVETSQSNDKVYRNGITPILKNYEKDVIFELIQKVNSIDGASDLIGSFLGGSEKGFSKLRREFQVHVVKCIKTFRKEVIEGGGFSQFRNDLATMEICGGIFAVAFFQMNGRGVDEDLVKKILMEGIRSIFSITGPAQHHPVGAKLISIIDSYGDPDENEISEYITNMAWRLIACNLTGSIEEEYSRDRDDWIEYFREFVPTMDPGLTNFVRKLLVEIGSFVDLVMDYE